MNGDFDGLVYRFFWTLARFEYALKATGFHRHDHNDAAPDWKRFAKSAPVRGVLDDPVGTGLTEAIEYIVTDPPESRSSRTAAWRGVTAHRAATANPSACSGWCAACATTSSTAERATISGSTARAPSNYSGIV